VNGAQPLGRQNYGPGDLPIMEWPTDVGAPGITGRCIETMAHGLISVSLPVTGRRRESKANLRRAHVGRTGPVWTLETTPLGSTWSGAPRGDGLWWDTWIGALRPLGLRYRLGRTLPDALAPRGSEHPRAEADEPLLCSTWNGLPGPFHGTTALWPHVDGVPSEPLRWGSTPPRWRG
jgi:hypothetical protein